jgi:hypothetical protein
MAMPMAMAELDPGAAQTWITETVATTLSEHASRQGGRRQEGEAPLIIHSPHAMANTNTNIKIKIYSMYV